MEVVDSAYQKYCKKRFLLPSEQEILDVEQRVGVPLPEDYRSFLATYNGGTFREPDITPTTKECPRDALTFLHGIHATFPAAVLASGHDLALFDDNFPVEILPIGYTMMGGLIILETGEEERGAILLKEAFGDFYYLCKGIRSFFELLVDPPTREEQERGLEESKRKVKEGKASNYMGDRLRCKFD